MATMVGFDPSDQDNNDHQKAKYLPGEKYEFKGKSYRYILVEDANLAVGDVVMPAAVDNYTVTNDYTGGNAIALIGVGVATSIITDGQYGFVQVEGVVDAKVHTDTAAGDPMIGPNATDGTAEVMAAGEEHLVFAFALEADDTGVAAIRLQIGG